MAIYTYNGSILTAAGGIAVDANCCCSDACYLLRECADVTSSCDPSGAGVCSPPMQNKVVITFAGLGGDFASFNGSHTLTKADSFCSWSDININLGWVGSPFNLWEVQLATDPLCLISWRKNDATGCDPLGSYTYSACTVDNCADSGSCSSSSGATCTVEWGTYANDIIVDDDLSTYAYGDVIKYGGTCYFFIGVVDCPASPTTMTTWTDHATCSACASS